MVRLIFLNALRVGRYKLKQQLSQTSHKEFDLTITSCFIMKRYDAHQLKIINDSYIAKELMNIVINRLYMERHAK